MVRLSVAEAVYGAPLIGQAIAILPRVEWAPSGNRKLNRNTINVIEGQRLVVGEVFNSSTAVCEINRALQTVRRSRSTPNSDEITRTICGIYTPLPFDSVSIDGEPVLAKSIAEKKKMALRNPCDLFIIYHADSVLH